MKIILADPPDLRTPWLIANHPNLGILYLASYLRSRLPHLDIHYLETFLDLDEHLKRIQKIQPDLYGLSFTVLRKREAFNTLKAVRDRFPSLPIVCGGAAPTTIAEEILESTPADVCVRGEGEGTLYELVEAFRSNRRLDEIPGVTFKKNGYVVSTAKRSLIADLDSIPFPAWDLIDFSRYKGNYQYVSRPSTAIIASRGCPYDCVFCSNPVWKLSKPWLRLRSPSNIAREVSLLYGRGIREISIRSDEFNPVLAWTLEVCREIRKLNLKDLFFQGNLRADKVTDELAREMKEANFWLVQLGVESGNQNTLNGIDKKIKLEQIVNACRHSKTHGLKVYGYIMIYNAWEEEGKLRHETCEDVDQTFAFIRRLKRAGLIDYMSFSTTTPIPGSRLYEIARRHGIIKNNSDLNDLSQFTMDLPHASRREMKRSRLKGLVLQSYINLLSGHNNLTDWGKNWHKVKVFLRSI